MWDDSQWENNISLDKRTVMSLGENDELPLNVPAPGKRDESKWKQLLKQTDQTMESALVLTVTLVYLSSTAFLIIVIVHAGT